MTEALANLTTKVRAAQDEELEARTELPVEQRLAEIHAALGRRSVRAKRSPYLAGGLAVAAAAGVLLWLFLRPAPPLTAKLQKREIASGTWLRSAGEAEPVTFSDGTALTLAPNAAMRLVHVDDRGATVALERGELHVSVVHRADARWQVAAGPFHVLVTGTRFDASFDPAAETLRVAMAEGSVQVSGGCLERPRRLADQEVAEFSCKQQEGPKPSKASSKLARPNRPAQPSSAQPSSAQPSSAQPSLAQPENPQPTMPTPSGVSSVALPAQSWQQLSKNGHFKAALAAAEARGFSTLCASGGSGGLVELGNVARLAGNPARAAEAYLALRKRFAGSAAAGTAAFQLGRLAFDGSGDYAAARRWFGVYLREQPGGRFAQEALGRRMEAEQRQGDREAASATAARYLARFPSGAHAALAHSLSSE